MLPFLEPRARGMTQSNHISQGERAKQGEVNFLQGPSRSMTLRAGNQRVKIFDPSEYAHTD